MIAVTIFGAVASYVVVAVLLLSLNVTSLWRWWIKGAAIVATTGFFVWTYVALVGLLGWANPYDLPPPRFKVVWTEIVEPEPEAGNPGAIYLWVEELDANNVPSGIPRSYQIAYIDQLAEDLRGVQDRREAGEEVMGELQQREPGEDEREQGTNRLGNRNVDPLDNSRTDSVPDFNDSQVMTFQDLPPIVTPDKVP